jgi:hypothetical protein
MKRFSSLLLGIFFSFSVFAQAEDTTSVDQTRNTRGKTITEVFTIDTSKTILESPLLESFEGIGIAPVKEAYKLNRLRVDSILAADSLNPNFWRVYGYQVVYIFKEANQSPKMAMAIFLPWFLVLFLAVVGFLTLKTVFVRPWVSDAIKPENDPNASIEEPEEKGEEAGTNK